MTATKILRYLNYKHPKMAFRRILSYLAHEGSKIPVTIANDHQLCSNSTAKVTETSPGVFTIECAVYLSHNKKEKMVLTPVVANDVTAAMVTGVDVTLEQHHRFYMTTPDRLTVKNILIRMTGTFDNRKKH
jgi:hypothetical protein